LFSTEGLERMNSSILVIRGGWNTSGGSLVICHSTSRIFLRYFIIQLTIKKANFHSTTAGFEISDPDSIIYLTDNAFCEITNPKTILDIQDFDLRNMKKPEVKKICLAQDVPFSEVTASKTEMGHRFFLHKLCPGRLVEFDERFAPMDSPDLRNILCKMVSGPSESDGPGEIYAYYHVETSSSDVKIGCTEKGVENRLKQWTASCGQDIELAHDPWNSKLHKFAEGLIHAELKARGMWAGSLRCEKCGRDHREWFSGDLEEIKDIVAYWIAYCDDLEVK
jgi:hypothetical protein